MSIQYYFLLADKDGQGNADPEFAFHSQGAEGLAQELEDALRTDALFQRWRARQDEPEEVDATLGVTDPQATVVGHRRNLQTELIVTTSIPGNILKQRLRLLAGSDWTLRDVRSA